MALISATRHHNLTVRTCNPAVPAAAVFNIGLLEMPSVIKWPSLRLTTRALTSTYMHTRMYTIQNISWYKQTTA